MVNNEVFRSYRMTDPELTGLTQSVCSSITRDITDFTLYGITATNVTALQTLCDAFEIFPTDEYVLIEVKAATDNKKYIYDQILPIIRSNALRVDLIYGKKSPEAGMFYLSNITKLSDNAFLTKTKMISKFLTENKTELASAGLTQLMIDELDDLIVLYEDAIELQENKNKERANLSIERILKGNEIFELTSRYCDIGKRIWENVNPARYADYVIYGTTSPTVLTPPANFAYSLIETDLTWDIVPNATSYQIEESADNITWSEIYADQFNLFSFTPSVSGTRYYRCRARNTGGYGEFSETISIEYYTTLPAPQNVQIASTGPSGLDIEISWDLVPTANSYWPYRNVVNIGSPAGTFSYQGVNVPKSPYTQTVAAGKRYYYKIKAANPLQESVFSDIVFIDVP